MNTLPMFDTCQPLILASSSPRRKELLSQFGLVYKTFSSTVDEIPAPGENPEAFVLRMAERKALDVGLLHPRSWIVGADTAITLDGSSIIGKPATRKDALLILKALSGREHQVLTGLCLCRPDKKICRVESVSTRVTFINASDDLLRAYIATGEPMDKAGSYGIQGLGSFLVREISGSCSNVIGLPLSRLITLLLEYEIITPHRSCIR